MIDPFAQHQRDVDIRNRGFGIDAGGFAARDGMNNAERGVIDRDGLAFLPLKFFPWGEAINQKIAAKTHRIDCGLYNSLAKIADRGQVQNRDIGFFHVAKLNVGHGIDFRAACDVVFEKRGQEILDHGAAHRLIKIAFADRAPIAQDR